MLQCASEVWQISGVPPKQTKQPADNERHDSFLTKNLLLRFHFFLQNRLERPLKEEEWERSRSHWIVHIMKGNARVR